MEGKWEFRRAEREKLELKLGSKVRKGEKIRGRGIK